MVLKLKHETKGDHVHIDVFVGDGYNMALAGSLTMRRDEWHFLRVLLACGPMAREGRVIVYEDKATGKIDRRLA